MPNKIKHIYLQNANKMIVLQGIIVHDVLGLPKIVLDQIREGLQILTFGSEMKQYPELFQELFVPHDKECSNSDVIKVFEFLQTMTADETTIQGYLIEFLQTASPETLKQFLIFTTGTPCLPNFGLGNIEVKFDNVTSIFASTCLMAITFPQVFPNQETFSSSIEAVLTSKTKSFNCV